MESYNLKFHADYFSFVSPVVFYFICCVVVLLMHMNFARTLFEFFTIWVPLNRFKAWSICSVSKQQKIKWFKYYFDTFFAPLHKNSPRPSAQFEYHIFAKTVAHNRFIYNFIVLIVNSFIAKTIYKIKLI